MAQANNYITKNEMMFFQNEVFIDLKNIESSVNSKIAKVNENTSNVMREFNQKFEEFSNKIKDLLELISVINIDHEKVEELYRNKEKIKEELSEHKARFNQFKKMIDSSLYRYDRVIIDNMEVPGIIGHNCKFNNIGKFLEMANAEINAFKIFKTQLIEEMKIIKDRQDKISLKLDISNKDIIQRVDLIYNNKFDTFKKEIDNILEARNQIKSIYSNENNIVSHLEKEIKNNQELSNQFKEDINNEINNITNELKKNKAIIDSNYILIKKQKEDYNQIKENFDKLSNDIECLKKMKNENGNNDTKKINNNNIQKFTAKNYDKNKNIKKHINQLLSSKSLNIQKNNNNTSKKKNDDIKYIITNDKRRNSLFIKNNINLIENIKINSNSKARILTRNNKKGKTLIPSNLHNSDLFINYKNEHIFQRISKKKLLTYNKKANFIFKKMNLNKNHPINILDLSSSSFTSSSDENTNREINLDYSIKKEKNNKKIINKQINTNFSKNIEINKKVNKNVTKLVKLKPIEKPLKLNFKNKFESNNLSNNENLNIKENNINNNLIQNKEKTVNFAINSFNKSKTQNKKNPNENNNKELHNAHRNLNLNDKEILKNYVKNIIEKKDNDVNSITNAIHIKNYKNTCTSPNIIVKQNNLNSLIDEATRDLDNNNSQRNSNYENYSSNESNIYMTYPYITTKNLSSLYKNTNKNTSNLKKNSNNEINFRNNEMNILNGFLTSIPIKQKSNNEKEDANTVINKKIKKINSNIKIFLNRINSLEENVKPLISQINDISMIISLIYNYMKKRKTNNIFNNDILNNINIKNHSKNKKTKERNNILYFNKTKNFLYTTNFFNFNEELYSTKQTKEELKAILKKIESFLIKQFKDTI